MFGKFTKCQNEHCPLKNGCLRFTAPNNPEGQSYAIFKFEVGVVNEMQIILCKHFKKNRKDEESKQIA